MEASCPLDMKGREMPPTIRCVNCGYTHNSIYRVNRLNFHMARIQDDETGLHAAGPPKNKRIGS
jgi:hypothetical protein